MKYAHIENKTNKLLGWYDSDIHEIIPEPNIEISEKLWQDAVNINANCYEKGKFIIKDFRTKTEKEDEDKKLISLEAKQYLKDTDWYVTRKLETNKDIPSEITAKRAEARLKI